MILILGAKGMLGQALAKLFGHQATGWGRDDFDITNIQKSAVRIKELKPAVIINCAAYNAVDEAEIHPRLAYEINAESVGALAKMCKDFRITLVHFSTNYIFEGTKGEYKEDDAPNPQSVYAKSKFAGERAIIESGCNFYLIRTAVLFGPRGSGETSKKSFVDLMLELGKTKNEVRAINNEVNSITYAVDLAGQVKLLLEEEYPFGIYHITNSGAGSWYDLAAEIFKIADRKVKVIKITSQEFGSRAANRPKKAILLNTKLPPLRSWQEAVKAYITLYL